MFKISETLGMHSKKLWEMIEGDCAEMCAGTFLLVSMGSEQRVSHVATRERGPPSAPAKIKFT